MDKFELFRELIALIKEYNKLEAKLDSVSEDREYFEKCVEQQFGYDEKREFQNRIELDMHNSICAAVQREQEEVEKKIMKLIKKRPQFFIYFRYLASPVVFPEHDEDDSCKITKEINRNSVMRIIYILSELYK